MRFISLRIFIAGIVCMHVGRASHEDGITNAFNDTDPTIAYITEGQPPEQQQDVAQVSEPPETSAEAKHEAAEAATNDPIPMPPPPALGPEIEATVQHPAVPNGEEETKPETVSKPYNNVEVQGPEIPVSNEPVHDHHVDGEHPVPHKADEQPSTSEVPASNDKEVSEAPKIEGEAQKTTLDEEADVGSTTQEGTHISPFEEAPAVSTSSFDVKEEENTEVSGSSHEHGENASEDPYANATAAMMPPEDVQKDNPESGDVPTTNPGSGDTPPPYGVIYDEKDFVQNSKATHLDMEDILGSESNKVSDLTMGIDQEWLNREKTTSMVQRQMPTCTGFSYDKGTGLFTSISDKPTVRGGVLQSVIDKEAEIRRRNQFSVQIDYDLRLRVNRESAAIIVLLTKGSIKELRSKHPLVFSRIIEPLRTTLAISKLNRAADQITKTYDRKWYVTASPQEKKRLLDNIRKDTGRTDLFVSKVKKPKKMTEQKRKVYDVLDQFYEDFQCQKIVRGNQVARQLLRMFDQQSGLYVAPFYTDVVPALGSQWLISKFERFYRQTELLSEAALARGLHQMVGRYMLMIENGTLLPTSSELQIVLYALSMVLSRIMRGVTEPKTFLGRAKYYGFMGMCNEKCFRGIMTDHPNGDPKKKFFLNKQREILRWISLYLRDDMLKIDTMVQKLLLELLFRTTNDGKYLQSPDDIDMHISTEYLKDNKDSLLQLPNAKQNVDTDKDSLHRLTRRFLSGYRLPGRRVNNKAEYKAIAPYNAFKSPNKTVASLDDGLVNMIEVVIDVVNLHLNGDPNNLYLHSHNTWIQLHTFYNAIHSFEPISTKNKKSSKTMGSIFRFLNSDIKGHVEAIPMRFLPYTSLVLQMSFFLQTYVEGYERTTGKAVKNLLRGLSKFNFKGRMGPKNLDQLSDYFEPQVIFNRTKYKIGRGIVFDLVEKFKSMFLAKPAIPAPIIQLISVFIGQWTKAASKVLDMADPNIDRLRRSFFLSYMSNRSDMAEVATDIVMKYCKRSTDVLFLGCLTNHGVKNVKCKQLTIKMKRPSVLKVMQMLDATFDDALDVVRIASDTARRCMVNPGSNKQRNGSKKKEPRDIDRLMLFAEITHRYHCYNAQKTMVDRLTRAFVNRTNRPTADLIAEVFSSMRTISVRHSGQNGVEQKLVCPFMDDAPVELRERHRKRILNYVLKKLTLRKKLAVRIRNVVDMIRNTPQDLASSLGSTDPLKDLVGSIMVTTRKYDGIVFYGGYAPPEKIVIPKGITLNQGDGRLVYDGTVFMSELDALRDTASVNAISMEKKKGIVRRIYHLKDGKSVDELSLGLKANNFIVKAHVLITASGINSMGYSIGKFIWCGYEHGWVADFALQDVIGTGDIPVYNGTYWLLSSLMSVGDMVGSVPIKNGQLITEMNIGDINLSVYSSDGKRVANYPKKASNTAPFANAGQEITYTLDTGYGNISPAAIKNLVRNAEFDATNNLLVINLDAPGAVLMEAPIVSKF